MKMTHEQLVAEWMVEALLGEYFVLTEDRIDDLIKRYPDANLNRHIIDSWMEFDPSRNKKYMPWIIAQVAKGQIKLPEEGEHLRDNLLSFERLVTIPAYTGPRDFYQIKSHEELTNLINQFGTLRSQSQIDREKREAKKKWEKEVGVEDEDVIRRMPGQRSLAKVGPYEVIEITSVPTLNAWAWRAYSHPVENPNWTPKKPITPEMMPPNDIADRKWCVRWPTYATTYLSNEPFILVLKNGGPYVGIVWGRGECQNLDNQGISTSVAEEIYPVLQAANALPREGQGGRNTRVFDNLKFLHGDVKDGDTITGPVDLANTQLSQLPNNLTVKGTLDLTNCPLKQLPAGLKVEGTLKISGTPITELPEDLAIEDMEWSEPLDWTVMKSMFYRMRLPEMENHYKQYLKDSEATMIVDPKSGKKVYPKDAEGKSTKPKSWPVMKAALVSHFQTDPDIDKNVKTLYRYVKSSAPAATPPEE
jgi:hypothetical protein